MENEAGGCKGPAGWGRVEKRGKGGSEGREGTVWIDDRTRLLLAGAVSSKTEWALWGGCESPITSQLRWRPFLLSVSSFLASQVSSFRLETQQRFLRLGNATNVTLRRLKVRFSGDANPTMAAPPLFVAGLSFDSVAAVKNAINLLSWPHLSLVSVGCVCQTFLISIIAAHGATNGRQQHPSRLTQSQASYLHCCICLAVLLIRQLNLNPNILQQAPVDSRQLLSLTYWTSPGWTAYRACLTRLLPPPPHHLLFFFFFFATWEIFFYSFFLSWDPSTTIGQISTLSTWFKLKYFSIQLFENLVSRSIISSSSNKVYRWFAVCVKMKIMVIVLRYRSRCSLNEIFQTE